MITPLTCLTVVCDGCDTIAENDDGAPLHFTTETQAREWLGLDPHATVDDDLARWHFGPDGTHLCPDCQCAAHGHLPGRAHRIGPSGEDPAYLGACCQRCGRWLDLGRPDPTPHDAATDDAATDDAATDDAATAGRRA